MTNTSKWCLLNTDLRSVSNAALRKLWHSYQRFWNAPIAVLIIIIAHWKNCKIISLQLFLLVFVIKWMILKCSNLVFCRLATVDLGLDLLKRGGRAE